MAQQTVSRYRILGQLGAGGMGIVYEAEDTRLGRRVALKFLPGDVAKDPAALERLRREARAASALSHPNICTIHDIDQDGDRHFLVMERLEGQPLAEKIAGRPLPLDELLPLAVQIADALQAAHAKGIIHRDLKPSNIFVTRETQAKLLDFGLAKIVPEARAVGETSLTSSGETPGTLVYMSPEQVQGKPLDARSDLFSFGVVLYAMATGTLPFKGESSLAIAEAILHDRPATPAQSNPELPPELGQIITKALEKDRELRYQSAQELRDELKQLLLSLAPLPAASFSRFTRSVTLVLVAIIFGLALVAFWLVRRNARIQWARNEAVPRASDLVDRGRYTEAFQLAERAERYIPSDPVLRKLWPEMAAAVTIHSQPEGAAVYLREYDSNDNAWEYLGRTPIEKRRLPRVFFRWRVEKPGFEPVYRATGWLPGYPLSPKDPQYTFALQKLGSVPPGMVFINGGNFKLSIAGLDHLDAVRVPDYWLDKYEVTNQEFKQFVTAGGYTRPEFWKEPFLQNGRVIPWQRAMEQFRDKTGRPGPASWSMGDYPEGQENYPVSGVSWYEAAAYAQFAGKRLPTIYQWNRASGASAISLIVPLSNFGSQGPVKVGSTSAMSTFGTYDMAGNVKEWCWNESHGKRYILGGAWSDPAYMFTDEDAQDPFRRSPTYGFRLAQYSADAAAPMMAAVPELSRDYSREKPVSDEVFRVYRSLFAYDKKPLDANLEESDNGGSETYRVERVSFTAAYGNERVTAYVFLPKAGKPPYQTVIFFPGSDAIARRDDVPQLWRFRFLLKTGRAVVYPIYKGTYSRGDELNSDYPAPTSTYRDHVIYWSKDLGRTIDYLESRGDLDHDRIAYVGFSWGAAMGAVLPALEPRLKTLVLVGGGFMFQHTYPEVDAVNFAPRVTQPTLMINGRYDHFFSVELLQDPMFRALGTLIGDKRHVLLDSGHTPPNDLLIKETLDWLDRYLGPVH